MIQCVQKYFRQSDQFAFILLYRSHILNNINNFWNGIIKTFVFLKRGYFLSRVRDLKMCDTCRFTAIQVNLHINAKIGINKQNYLHEPTGVNLGSVLPAAGILSTSTSITVSSHLCLRISAFSHLSREQFRK